MFSVSELSLVNHGFLCGIILPPWAYWPGPLELTWALGVLGLTGGSTLTPYWAHLDRLPGCHGLIGSTLPTHMAHGAFMGSYAVSAVV